MIQKTLFFDIGNVQLFFDHRKMCNGIAHLFGLEQTQVSDFFFNEKLLDEWESGKIHSQYLYNTFSSLSKNQVDYSAFLHAFSNIFTPNTSLFPILETLKKEIDDIKEFVQAAKKCGLDSELFENSAKLQKQLIAKGFLNETI